MKSFKLLIAVLCIAFASMAYATSTGNTQRVTENTAMSTQQKVVSNQTKNERSTRSVRTPISHGTHLCEEHEDCGTGHMCCSGHCKKVDTCG